MDRQLKPNHFLVLVFPAHGHINPALELSNRLITTGAARVTFVTCMSSHKTLLNNSNPFPDALTFEPLFHTNDAGFKSADDASQYLSEMKRGEGAISGLIEKAAAEGRPVTCFVYTILFPWTFEVVRKYRIFSALLWVKAATTFAISYYCFNGYRDLINDSAKDPEGVVQLPGLPLFKTRDLPAALLPSGAHPILHRFSQEQFDILSSERADFWILMNTFDGLEMESLCAVKQFNLKGVGPLIPMALLDSEDPVEISSGGDLRDQSKEYLKWLDSQDKSSVVYVAFGSLAALSDKQTEALAHGLVDSGRPFLWVIQERKEDGKCNEILCGKHKGMVVPWCSQVEVLNHGSIGCFVTHCGWNSTLEAVAMGVPMVTFTQWHDQGTNAKLIVDLWKMGVRVTPNDDDKIVHSEEIIRCLELVMESDEFRNNARKWKDLAKQAVKHDGSSQKNLLNFIEAIRQFYS